MKLEYEITEIPEKRITQVKYNIILENDREQMMKGREMHFLLDILDPVTCYTSIVPIKIILGEYNIIPFPIECSTCMLLDDMETVFKKVEYVMLASTNPPKTKNKYIITRE